MTRKTSLEKEIAQAEDRLLPKDGGDSLQRRLEDYARRFEEGDDDGLLSKYPTSLFEPTPEILHKKPVEEVSGGETTKTMSEGESANLAQSSAVYRPLDEFEYTEIAEGWTERIETRPDGTTIRYVSIDLTQVPPDAADYDRDIPSWDWSPGPRPPSLRDVERMIKDGL